MPRLHRLAATAIALCLAAALPASPAFAADLIRVLCPSWPGFAPVFVAKDLGYFAADGLEVDIRFEDDRSNVAAAMARGDIEIDMRTVGEPSGRPRDQPTPGIIIGTIDKSVGGDGVIADGSIGSVKDLKGKTVASEPGIPARLLLQLVLREAGMTLKDIVIKEIATADTAAAFSDPAVAAVASYEPFMSQAMEAVPDRKPTLLISSRESGIIIDIVIARADDLAAHPGKYAAFLRGIYRAIALYGSDPAQFIKLAAPHYDITEAELKDILDTGLAYTGYGESSDLIGAPGNPGGLKTIFQMIMELNMDNGAADDLLDADSRIDASVMPNADPGK